MRCWTTEGRTWSKSARNASGTSTSQRTKNVQKYGCSMLKASADQIVPPLLHVTPRSASRKLIRCGGSSRHANDSHCLAVKTLRAMVGRAR